MEPPDLAAPWFRRLAPASAVQASPHHQPFPPPSLHAFDSRASAHTTGVASRLAFAYAEPNSVPQYTPYSFGPPTDHWLLSTGNGAYALPLDVSQYAPSPSLAPSSWSVPDVSPSPSFSPPSPPPSASALQRLVEYHAIYADSLTPSLPSPDRWPLPDVPSRPLLTPVPFDFAVSPAAWTPWSPPPIPNEHGSLSHHISPSESSAAPEKEESVPSQADEPQRALASAVRRTRSDAAPELSNRKYMCQQCKKGFARPSALATHMFIHTQEKPFCCPTCLRSFAVMSNLRRHCKVRGHKLVAITRQLPVLVAPTASEADAPRLQPSEPFPAVDSALYDVGCDFAGQR